jgi:allantoicase
MRVSNSDLMIDVVLDATRVSDAIPLPNIYGFAIQAVVTGTPNGTFKLQASVDAFKYANDNQPQVPTNWTDIADSAFTFTSAGSFVWNFTGCFYTFVRLVYTDASGGSSTATVNAVINVKGA